MYIRQEKKKIKRPKKYTLIGMPTVWMEEETRHHLKFSIWRSACAVACAQVLCVGVLCNKLSFTLTAASLFHFMCSLDGVEGIVWRREKRLQRVWANEYLVIAFVRFTYSQLFGSIWIGAVG